MIVAGVMSGTSADGIDIALVKIEHSRRVGRRNNRDPVTIRLLAHAEYPYPASVRHAVLAAMNAREAKVADLSRLNFLLGELYAEAVLRTQRRFRIKAELVGCHGQTLYHQGDAAPFLAHRIAATWQTGEASVIASRVGIPVVSDFRPADMSAGGKGAPLVPYLDYLLCRDRRIGRVIQNIGGIANLTAIPAGASADRILAFDTGPGNMVIDAVTELLFNKPYDRQGKDGRFRKGARWRGRGVAAKAVLSPQTAEDGRARGIWTGIRRGVSCASAAEQESKISLRLQRH